jgi:hypothetical protein
MIAEGKAAAMVRFRPTVNDDSRETIHVKIHSSVEIGDRIALLAVREPQRLPPALSKESEGDHRSYYHR